MRWAYLLPFYGATPRRRRIEMDDKIMATIDELTAATADLTAATSAATTALSSLLGALATAKAGPDAAALAAVVSNIAAASQALKNGVAQADAVLSPPAP